MNNLKDNSLLDNFLKNIRILFKLKFVFDKANLINSKIFKDIINNKWDTILFINLYIKY